MIRFGFILIKHIINNEEDAHVRILVISIVLYFLDFVLLNCEKYYNIDFYVE